MPTVRSAFVVLGLTLAVTLAAVAADAQTVYFSNLTGHQVLSIDGTTGGTPTVVLPTSSAPTNSAFSAEDLVIGPDGKLYICDVGNSWIWRYDPVAMTVERIVDFGTAVNTATGLTVVPVGPTFSGSDDLYVNTRTSVGGNAAGVWVIPGVAAQSTPTPYTPQQVIGPFTSVGQGSTVEAFGQLLLVDQANNRVLASQPHQRLSNGLPAASDFGPGWTTLIPNVTAPTGIATDTCGDVLVGTGATIQRFVLSKNMTTNVLSVQSQNTYIAFPRGDVVMYFERDAGNNLYVATNSSTAGGKVWKIVPSSATDPIGSCSTGVAASPAPLVTLKKFTTGSTPLLTSAQAVGLTIPATDLTIAKTFSPSQPSNTYNFGHYSLTLTYQQILPGRTFAQRFTALMSRPANISFGPAFPSGTVGMRYPSLGGYVIQFKTDATQVAGTDFAPSTSTNPAFTITLAFHDPLQGFRTPGLAHTGNDPATNTTPTFYTDNVTSDFWVLFDQATRGSGSNWGSTYVPFDSPLANTLALPLTVTINQPAQSNNPLFNIGQNFTVSITVTDANGQTVPGLGLRISAAKIDPLPIALQVVQPTNNPAQGNLMSDNGNGKYSIGIDTSLFTAGTGTYQFTIFGQGIVPLAFNERFQK